VWTRTPHNRWPGGPQHPRPTRLDASFSGGEPYMYHLVDPDEDADPNQLRRRARAGLRQVVYLEPLGNDFLFGASMPLAYEIDRDVTRRRGPILGSTDEVRLAHKAGIRYVVYSDVDPPPASDLRAAPANFLPEGFDAIYLQLPTRCATATTCASPPGRRSPPARAAATTGRSPSGAG
jgi:hypothetical protein